MADEKYNPYEGFHRVALAAENLNTEAVEVVTFHFALEREIEIVLSKRLTRTDKISRLGFINKAAVLHSMWHDTATSADRLYKVLHDFNELRNAFAHNNVERVDACRRNLIDAYRTIDPNATEPVGYAAITQSVCAFMGGGPTPDEFREIANSLSKLVNETLPKASAKDT